MLSWNIGNKQKKAFFSILNGSEPQYDLHKWNDSIKIKKNHNCYAYVLDIIDTSFKSKPQPGYASGYSYLSDNDIRKCDKMFERISGDNETFIKSTYKKPCPKGYNKGYLAVDDGEDTDYHFYRLDSNGFWSHKPGSTNVQNKNFNGNNIIAPHKARRESNSHNYKKSCGYFCFKKENGKLSNKPNKKNINNINE